jgi:transcriptional regulator with XRE-family HTH domain
LIMIRSSDPVSPSSFTTFGELLKYLRRREHFTQLELSIKVGYSEAQISRLEKNQRLPDPTGIMALFIPALHLEDEPEFAARLLELAQSTRQADAPAAGIAPYKGLLYFDESDTELFFGREALTAQLVKHVMDLVREAPTRFLAVVGASGSGKSSLVRAGLAVALRKAGWEVIVFTPTAHPLRQLDSRLSEARRENAGRVLILVDQFEEMFTLCRDEIERITFIEKLLVCAQEKSKMLSVVIALRADFYPHCSQYPLLRKAVAAEQEYIGQMTQEELRQAIEEPARRNGWEFEPGLVDVLLQDLSTHGANGSEPGALPLLSHALLATWERRRRRKLTLEGYHASGGVRGAIAETAESVFTDKLNQKQQEIAHHVFLRLTELGEGTEDTRRRVSLNELVSEYEEAVQLRAVLNTLAEARLITLNEDSAEVAHEALIREWQRLHEWLTQDREGLLLHRHLTESAHAWEIRRRDVAELYRGARLAQAQEWATANIARLNQTERDYLTASIDHEQHEAQEREALRQREVEAAQSLAAFKQQRADEKRKALHRLHYSAMQAIKTADIPAAEDALHPAVPVERLLDTLLAHAESLYGVAFYANSAPGARRLATASMDDTIKIWRVDETTKKVNRNPLVTISNPTDFDIAIDATGYSLAFSPDGKKLAAIGSSHTAKIWDVASGKLLVTFSGHTNNIFSLAFSPKEELLATGSLDGTALVWDTRTGQQLQTLIVTTTDVCPVVFNRDGKRLANGDGAGRVIVWDRIDDSKTSGSSDRFTQSFSIEPQLGMLSAIAFNPDGKKLAIGSYEIKVYDISTATATSPARLALNITAHQNFVNGLFYSLDERRLISASGDGSSKVWDAVTGQVLFTLLGNASPVTSISHTSDGEQLFTAHGNGQVIVWDLSVKSNQE